MAIRTIRVDDLTGEPLAESVEATTLVYKGRRYELDLSDASVRELDQALARFLTRERVDPDEIRRWGRDNGFDVKPSGRLPAALTSAFNDRHGRPDVASK